MLTQLFNSSRSQMIIFIIFLLFLLWAQTLFGSAGEVFSPYHHTLPGFSDINSWLGIGSLPVISSIFAIFIMLIQASILSYFDFKFKLLKNKSFLPALFFVILASSFIETQQFHSIQIASLLFSIAILRMFQSVQEQRAISHVFDAAFSVSLASLFYLPMGIFIFFVWSSILHLRPFVWKEWVASILGFSLPYMLYFGFYFVFTGEIQVLFHSFIDNIFILQPISSLNISHYFLLGFLAVFVFLASISYSQNFSTLAIRSRNYFKLFFIIFAISIIVFLIFPAAGSELFYLMSISLAFLFSFYTQFIRSKWSGDLVLFVFLALIVFNHFFYLFPV